MPTLLKYGVGTQRVPTRRSFVQDVSSTISADCAAILASGTMSMRQTPRETDRKIGRIDATIT
jgi:hypothetical protein